MIYGDFFCLFCYWIDWKNKICFLKTFFDVSQPAGIALGALWGTLASQALLEGWSPPADNRGPGSCAWSSAPAGSGGEPSPILPHEGNLWNLPPRVRIFSLLNLSHPSCPLHMLEQLPLRKRQKCTVKNPSHGSSVIPCCILAIVAALVPPPREPHFVNPN